MKPTGRNLIQTRFTFCTETKLVVEEFTQHLRTLSKGCITCTYYYYYYCFFRVNSSLIVAIIEAM